MSWLKRTLMAGNGKHNWFGDGSDGDIRVTSTGAEQSFDGGVTWATITAWLLVGTVVSIPSVQDGDMVVVNARNLTEDSGYTLTVANRCRGLLVYCQGTATINGELSMTARGCHANPADATVTGDTPVAPTDGHAVPAGGICIRRLAAGYTDTDHATDLMYGCGQAAVDSEFKQPPVTSNGIAIHIPRVGGAGGDTPGTDGTSGGNPGGTAPAAPGGGGSGAMYNVSGDAGDLSGSAGTCFSGGTGGGGRYGSIATSTPRPDGARQYGGAGGFGEGYEAVNSAEGGGGSGAGNPAGGVGTSSSYSGTAGEEGTGGLLILIARSVGGNGALTATGMIGGRGYYAVPTGLQASGGSSGGGLVAILAGAISEDLTLDVSGGEAANGYGGPGGLGAALKQIIDT